MGQKQSKQTEQKEEIIEVDTDVEHGSVTEIVTIYPLSLNSIDDDENEKPLIGKKPFIFLVVLTLIALIILAMTAPMVAKKEKPDGGNEVDKGETIPTNDVGALPNSSVYSTREPVNDEIDTNTQETGEQGNQSIASNTDDHGTQGNQSIPTSQESTTSLFPKLPFEEVNLPYFTHSVLGGYTNATQFEDALAEAAKFLINQVVLQNLGHPNSSRWAVLDNAYEHGFSLRGSTNGEESQRFHDVTDYETNNQEIGVDEADLIKAGSEYVYAAYRNYVLVWDKNGTQVAQAKMPTSTDTGEISNQRSINGGIFSMSGSRSHVESLLLLDGYLVVIVSGYGNAQSQEFGEQTALLNYKATQVRTYKTSNIASTGELILIGTKDINGRFVDARSIGNQVHIATSSGIDTYTYLAAPFQFGRYGNFAGLTDDEYIASVRSQATEKYIPEFVRKLSNELLYQDQAQNSVLPNLLQLNRWQKSPDVDLGSEAQAIIDAGMYSTGLMNSVTLITSLDVTAAPMVDPFQLSHELVTSTSGFLAPSQQVHLYGTASKLVLASRAWNWDIEGKATEEGTHLIVLNLDIQDANSEIVTTSFHSLGTVRGFLLNPHSLDIVDDEIRVATTIARRWRFQGTPQLSGDTVDVGDHYSDKVVMMDRSAGQGVVEDSTTENYITVLKLDRAELLTERGSVQVGEKDEVITAVRFFDDIAYCVTFEQTDPFYVVDLNKTEILGSFRMNGFSSYLHPINEDNTLLVGIGQNATSEGEVTGLLITVFDVEDPTDPKSLVSYSVDNTKSGSNGAAITSTVQWDYKSFRYVDGKLIIPLDIVSYRTDYIKDDAVRQTVLGTFEGFVVFNVDANSISEHLRISHTTLSCHSCGYLAPRSFVYDGNVITAEGNIVASNSLYSTDEQWAFHVAVIGEEARCCY